MSNPRFQIGDQVTFRHLGTTLEARIVGEEHVDDRRRRRGWHYVVRTSDGQAIDVHVDQIGGRVGEVAEVS